MQGARKEGVMDQDRGQGLSSVFREGESRHTLGMEMFALQELDPSEPYTGKTLLPTLTWDTWGNFSDWLEPRLWQPAPGELQAGRGCRPGVRACGCVHERGHGATHTHTHTLIRPHPRRALARASRTSQDLCPQASCFLGTSLRR